MKKLVLILLVLFVANPVFSQKKPFVIYNAKGKKVSYEKMLRSLSKNDILLFGESHDNPISHWLQYEVTSDLNAKKQLILGAEMLEADNQEILNDYLEEKIDNKALDSTARLWKNYKTDYAPLVNFAKKNKLPFIATNIPKRYANLVYKKGFEALDSLSIEEKEWIAPLPFPFDSELPTYKEILLMMGDHGNPELVKAQASKDATMAYFILKNYKKDHLFIHYNGSYHSDNFESILWYLSKYKPGLSIVTIASVEQADLNSLEEEYLNRANYILVIPEDMTKTH